MIMGIGVTDSTAITADPFRLPPQTGEVVGGELRNRNERFFEWRTCHPGIYRCEVHLQPEEEGGYSVYVPNLPGVVSEGEHKADALENIREALTAALKTYKADGQAIPWDTPHYVEGVTPIRRWIVVRV